MESINVELHVEIEPIAPDNARSVADQFRSVVDDALGESGVIAAAVTRNEVTFEQTLPLTPDQVEMLKVVIGFAVELGPLAYRGVRSTIIGIMQRLSGDHRSRVGGEITVDGSKIEFKGLSLGAAQKFVPEAMEALANSAAKTS